jgi:hypothetical protein
VVAVKRVEIWAAILAERERQAILWNPPHEWGEGDCSSPNVEPIVKAACLSEECGEVARAVLERDYNATERELIHVAAVAVAWLEGA